MLKLCEMQNGDVLGDNKILASTNIFFKKVLQAQGITQGSLVKNSCGMQNRKQITCRAPFYHINLNIPVDFYYHWICR